MRRVGTFVACVAIVGALGTRAAVTELLPQSEAARANAVQSRRGTPLASLIKPGQTTVVVEKDQSPPMTVAPPPGVKQLEWLTQSAETVMIVKVDKVAPELYPQGDWIKSTVHATVEEVLKMSAVTVSPGQDIRFGQDAGQMQFGNTAVRAVLPWAEPFETGDRYLLFAMTTPDPDEFVVTPFDSYLISKPDRTLIPVANRGNVTSERGTPLTNAVGRVRAAQQKGKTK